MNRKVIFRGNRMTFLFEGLMQALLFSRGLTMTTTTTGGINEIYRQCWGSMRTYCIRAKKLQDRYNFQLSSADMNDLKDQFMVIMLDRLSRFKIHTSDGVSLKHVGTKRYRYSHICQTTGRVLHQRHE